MSVNGYVRARTWLLAADRCMHVRSKYYILTGTLYNKIQEFYKIYTCNQAFFPIVFSE
jgi:hypothetical protein